MDCLDELPFLDYHLRDDNALSRRLDPTVNIDYALAMFAFHAGELVQSMIHRLKYENRPQIGIELGAIYGETLSKSPISKAFDVIVPVPIHAKRRAVRGYNQSLYFAKGLSQSMGVPVDDQSIKRIKNTTSQTRKSRLERIDNIKDAFVLSRSFIDKKYKHVLWVDDVITTGATIIGCIKTAMTSRSPMSAHSVACIATKDYLV